MLVEITDFLDSFSGMLGFTACFDAATVFLIASDFGCADFADADFIRADSVGANFMGFAFGMTAFDAVDFAGDGFVADPVGLRADFFVADAGLGLAPPFAGALRTFPALACAAVLPCAAAFAVFARPADAVFFFAILASTLETQRPTP